MIKKLAFLSCVPPLLFSLSLPVQAQEQWSWPEKPENLQVLPKDWPGKRLRPVMTGFSRALGVRCSHCHMGEEGKPLSTYDFASDENPNKDRAREMLRMLGSINDHLGKIEPSGDQRVNMWCHTCHKGRARPMTLAETLSETYRAKGAEATVAHRHALKERFFGRGSYNFMNEQDLNTLGYAALQKQDIAGALKLFELNAELFPKSANVWDSLAETHLVAGNKAKAVKFYTQSLSLNPKNTNAAEQLEKLKE